jgi:hypothetical protein
VNILGGHIIGHSKQKMYICTCVLFRTVSEIEHLSHDTVLRFNPSLVLVGFKDEVVLEHVSL